MKTQINYQNIRLDKNSPEPLHIQLKKALLKELRSFPSGQQPTLMSERELCALLNISRPTVHRTYQELFDSQLVIRNVDKSLSLKSDARSTIVGSYRVLGIMLPMDFSAYADNNYGNGMPYLRGLISRASQLNISCMMLQVPGEDASDDDVDAFLEDHIHRLYGIIHLGALHYGKDNGRVLQRIMARTEIPQICVAGFCKMPHIGSVIPDIVPAMKNICQVMKEKNLSSLGVVTGTDSFAVSPFIYYARYRESTMINIARRAGIKICGIAAAGNQEEITALLARQPDVIFCHNNRIAYDIMVNAQRCGMKVPDDIALIGYDRKTPDERISRIDPMAEEVAANAVDLVAEHFESGVTNRNRIRKIPVKIIDSITWNH